MKRLIFISFLLMLSIQVVQSQEQPICFNADSCIVVAISLDYGNKAQYSYQLRGEKADRLLSNLFSESEVPTVGIHKVRNIQIEGLDQTIKLRIHMGMSSEKEGFSGFRTYQSEEYRTALIENQQAFEKEGVLIYVLKNSPFISKEWRTDEANHKLILSYLEDLTN